MKAFLDSIYLACTDLNAGEAYERLGLTLTPPSDGRRLLHVGLGPQRFQLHLLAAAPPPLEAARAAALARGGGLFAVGLRVADLAAEVARLRGRGVVVHEGPAAAGRLAYLPIQAQAGTDLVLIEDGPALAGAPVHPFPLTRLDHLAAVAHDLDTKCTFWGEVLGIPVAGEVRTPTLLIRQLRLGDGVLELLGAASADSPIRQRPAGLISMASWQVVDLDAAVAQARAAGFTASDPAPGPLPATRISILPGAELAGVNLQLLQYV